MQQGHAASPRIIRLLDTIGNEEYNSVYNVNLWDIIYL